MKKLKKRLSALLLAAAVVTVSAITVPQSSYAAGKQGTLKNAVDYREGEAIVILEPAASSDANSMTLQSAKRNISLGKGIRVDEVYDVSGKKEAAAVAVSSETMSTEKMLDRLRKRSDVKYAVPNIKVKAAGMTDDEYSDCQWSQSYIKTDSLWDAGISCTDKVVAVIDTGIDYTHEELSSRMWRNPKAAKIAGIHGYDFVNGDDDPMDDNGHGTHVAGIIGAEADNGKGISGVCRDVKLMAIKALDQDGEGYLENMISAYSYISRLQDEGVDIVAVNNSWGADCDEEFYQIPEIREEFDEILKVFDQVIDAAGAKGALSVCAAGNSGINLDRGASVPGSGKSEYILNVAAVGSDGTIADYSNYGSESVDIAAPGTEVLSSVCYNSFFPSIYSAERKKATVHWFEGFETGTSGILFLDGTSEKGTVSSSVISASSSGDMRYSGNKSLCIRFDRIKRNRYYAVSVPLDLTGTEEPYLSFMASCESKEGRTAFVYAYETSDSDYDEMVNAGDESYALCEIAAEKDPLWNHVTAQLEESNVKEYITFVIQPVVSGTYTLYVDDLSVSRGKSSDIESDFGKYDLYSGTSMAAPHVTGAAALAEAYLESVETVKLSERASAVKDLICDTSRSAEEYAGIIGGILDLSLLQISPLIFSMEIKEGVLGIKGKAFSPDSQLILNGENVPCTVSGDGKTITAETSLKNTTVTVTVKTKGGQVSKTKYMVSGKKNYFRKTALPEVDNFKMIAGSRYPWIVSTDMNELTLYRYSGGRFARMGNISGIFDAETADTVEIVSETAVLGNVAYMIAAGRKQSQTEYEDGTFGSVVDTSYVSSRRLIGIRLGNSPSLVCCEELPEIYDNIAYPAVGAFNGKIYLLGGYDYLNDKASAKVTRFNPKTYSWKTAGLGSLPEGRIGGTAAASGSAMYYAMGANESGTVPRVIKYDGKRFTMSSVQFSSSDYGEIRAGSRVYRYYDGSISGISKGICINGIRMDGYGDTVRYVNGKYSASVYNFMKLRSEGMKSVHCGSYLYGIATRKGVTSIYRVPMK